MKKTVNAYVKGCEVCQRTKLLGMCQMVKDNSHEWRSAECVGFGEAISNITLEPKP